MRSAELLHENPSASIVVTLVARAANNLARSCPMMPKSRALIRGLVALPLLLLLPRASGADPIRLDQVQTAQGGGAAINECCAFVAQTYIAGLTGVLAAVDLD